MAMGVTERMGREGGLCGSGLWWWENRSGTGPALRPMAVRGVGVNGGWDSCCRAEMTKFPLHVQPGEGSPRALWGGSIAGWLPA